MSEFRKEYERWLNSDALTQKEKDELLKIKNDQKEIESRFSIPMSFGTAGLRSTMKLGISNMNRFTVAETTRAIASLIKDLSAEERGVVVVSDSRNNSEIFARVAASVLAYAGIRVYTFDGIRPTPELSFALREKGCIAGINITASHNPKEYNGYKAYWEDGAQIGGELARDISKRRESLDVLENADLDLYDKYVALGRITVLSSDFDEKYIAAVLKTAINKDLIKEVSDTLAVVYTPLHGAGYKLVPEVFKRAGLKKLYTVGEQMIPDGDFPTVKKPNPEYADVFTLGIDTANKVGSDLIIATDPDSDRVGVMSRGKNGEFATVTGNQMGALLLDYVIKQRREMGKMPEYAYAVKSIVSSDMAYGICKKNGVKIHDVLTGFKYIGEVIKNYEKEGKADGFLLGFEESYGYLLGTYARDKDAVGASLMILEMTAYYKKKNMTLLDALSSLYLEYGYYMEKTVDIYMEGVDGIRRRREVTESLRNNVPRDFGGYKVASLADYKTGKITDTCGNILGEVKQPVSDVLYYTLENEDKIKAVGIAVGVLATAFVGLKVGMIIQNIANAFGSAQKAIAEYTLKLLAANMTGQVSNATLSTKNILLGVLSGQMSITTAATMLWQKAQTKLNTALTANPIGIVVAAIAALIAIFVVAYNKSDAFKAIVDKLWATIKNNLMKVFEELKPYIDEIVVALSELWAVIQEELLPIILEIVEVVIALWTELQPIFEEVLKVVMGLFSSILNVIKQVMPYIVDTIKNALTVIKNVITLVTSLIKGDWNGVWNSIKNIFGTVWNQIKNTAKTVWNGIKSLFSSTWNGIKSTASNVVNGIKTTFSNAWTSIKNKTSSIWNNIKNAITKPIKDAKDKVTGWIDNIKQAFNNFKAKIKMPHIKIENASWNPKDWIENGIPKFKVEWYKKGAILNEPTVFDYNPSTQTAKVGGEAGAEAVAPIDTLMGYVQAAVRSETGGMNVVLYQILDLLSSFFPTMINKSNKQIILSNGVLVGELIDDIDEQLGNKYSGRGRGR